MSDDVVYALWCWIINANNGGGTDVDDLISIMDRSGLPCPDGLGEDV